jgi:hypothetical protein
MSLHFRTTSCLSINALLLAALVSCTGHHAQAQTIVLGSAASFAVLGSTTVTNTGFTTVTGDLGVSPSGSIVGFAPGVVSGGTIHLNDGTSALARTDASTAFTQLAALTSTSNRSGQDLGGLTLTSGVYTYSAAAAMNGILTLDGQNQSNALFVFQIGSTLTTTNSSFNLINGASASNVWFQVGSSATLGLNTLFSGTIIASTTDTLAAGVTVNGRVIALNGAVNLDTNQITNVAAIPEPATTAFIASGLTLLVVVGFRRRHKQAV